MPMTWPEVLALARRANDHYSLTEDEQEILWKLANTIPEGGMIVELGICHAKTSVILTAAAQNRKGFYCGIDNFSLEGSKEEAEELLGECFSPKNRGHLWKIHEADTHGHQWLWEEHELPIPDDELVDLLLIDADHSAPGVFLDCEVWIPQVRPGGIVVWDDVAHGPGWKDSPHVAVRESLEKWAGEWEHVAEWSKMWCRRKPLDAPQAS